MYREERILEIFFLIDDWKAVYFQLIQCLSGLTDAFVRHGMRYFACHKVVLRHLEVNEIRIGSEQVVAEFLLL